jgi:hypothetical protein
MKPWGQITKYAPFQEHQTIREQKQDTETRELTSVLTMDRGMKIPVKQTKSDIRPYIQLSMINRHKMTTIIFLIDTGSQITIITTVPPKPSHGMIHIQGMNGTSQAPLEKIHIQLYNNQPITIKPAFMLAPVDILGMDAISALFPEWLPLKRLKQQHTHTSTLLATISLSPVHLPKIEPYFTKQYPLKGGHEEITHCVQYLLEESIIERSQSFNFNSPIWPVLKPNASYRFIVDYRHINQKIPQMPGNLPKVAEIFNKLQRSAETWFSTIDSLIFSL